MLQNETASKLDDQIISDTKAVVSSDEELALLAEESKSRWADTDSDNNSSSESDEEVVNCMTVDDEEVFDFTSDEFTKTDLVNALNDMVIEYKKLSDSFNKKS